jgi:DNA-binding transcriptional LysR family regulator
MPAELVESDLARGTLVKLLVADAPSRGFVLTMRAVYPAEAPPGIAARWFIDRLKQGSQNQSPARKRLPRRKRA